MIDIKAITHKAIRTATSPTAFSWYGIAGVVATGVVTFLATCKWKDKHKDKMMEDEEPERVTVRDVVETALIFTPPVLIAAGTCYCIKHGNDKALLTVDKLMQANNFLSDKVSRTASAAAGVAIGEVKNRLDRNDDGNTCLDANLFSGDPAEIDDHGKVVLFYDSFCERWFESTIFDVLRAEEEVHKFFSLQGYVSVADFQCFLHLNIDGYEWTQSCGWDDNIGLKRGYLWVEFDHKRKMTDDGRVYYTIDYVIPPMFADEVEWIMHDEGDQYWVRS